MQNFLTKISYVGTIALICFFSIYPTKINAQGIAVPVYETNITLLANTALIVDYGLITSANSNYIAENTARISAKTTGYGASSVAGAPKPILGSQLVGESLSGSFFSADLLAKIMIKALIKKFTESVVRWVNTGFQGGPSFVTDPAQFFINVGDRAAGDFIQSSDLAFMCDPFYIKLALNLNHSGSFKDGVKCTLTDVIDNVENFTNDFTQGGWGGWLSMTQNASNNPYGQLFMAKVEMNQRIAQALNLKESELSMGGGFLSWRECLDTPDTMGPPAPGNGNCVNPGDVKTPGKVVESQLESSLGTDLQEYQLAENFDAIIQAVIAQVASLAITKVGGLLGE